VTTGTLPSLRLRLPGTWWQVPLHDRDEARESIRRLVSRQLGTVDARAHAREELRRHLLAALEEAIAGDGQAFHVALEIVPGIPIPVSIAVRMPDQAMTPSIGTSPDAVMGILERGIQQVYETEAAGESWATAHRFESRGSSILRLHRHQIVAAPDGVRVPEEAEPVDALVADYWMTVPSSKRVLLLTCSTALGPLEQTMLGFFDSIVRAAYWETPGDPA
jgi:hypothetical protein